MGANTKAIIRKGVTAADIAEKIKERYGSVQLHFPSHHFGSIDFEDGEDFRSIFVNFSNAVSMDYGISGVLLSLGCWGNSVEILKYLCAEFGGYIDENDSDGQGFYPINHELFQTGVDFTPLDEFKHKVISKLGYENLNAAMDLFLEYKTKI